jgi:hypothetical protein
VLIWLARAVAGQNRPVVADVVQVLAERCRRAGLRPPSRATVYALLDKLPTQTHRIAELPIAVRNALYNLTANSEVPGHQLVFYCFNYGDLAAVSFAAGQPWLAIHQARRMPGYRPKSRGLLEAVVRARNV